MPQTQEQRKAETRERLLAAAADLFARRGFHAVSTDAVAGAADRTSGAVYSHFGGKEGLLLALLDQYEQRAARRIGSSLDTAPAGRARLQALWQGFVGDPADDDADWLLLEHELLLHAARDEDAASILGDRYAFARQAIGEAFSQWADEDGADPPIAGQDLGVLVMALLLGLDLQRRLDPATVPDDLAIDGLSLLLGRPI